jgi:hypothetical protein
MSSAQFDVVLRNGLVVDGTGRPSIAAALGQMAPAGWPQEPARKPFYRFGATQPPHVPS